MRRKRDMMRNSRPATNPRPDANPSRTSGIILLPQRLLLVELLVIDKRLGILGGDWRFAIGGDPVYGTQDHKFRITLLCAFALEKSTQDRNVAEAGNFVPDIRDPVIDQTRNYETLTILQLEFGFRFASAQGGNREAGNCQSVGEIQSADFRCDNKVNVAVGHDHRSEFKLHSEFLEGNRDRGKSCPWLDDRKRKLAARQETRFLAIDGYEVGFGQNLEKVLTLQGLNHSPKVNVGPEQE